MRSSRRSGSASSSRISRRRRPWRRFSRREGQDWLRNLLEAVDDDDGSRLPLAPPDSALDLRFVWLVRLEDRGFGLARARNAGARAVAYDILVFLDADIVASLGRVAAHARWHHPVADALTLGFGRC